MEQSKELMMDTFDMDPAALENAISTMDVEAIDEFNQNVSFDKFVVLGKKELTNFCRLVGPLTKASVDDYGKSVFVRCLDNETVELCYFNSPYYISQKIQNKSGKQVKSFAVSVSNLQRLVTNAFASIILVEENDDINVAICESLLFLETKPLKEIYYDVQKKETNSVIDKELALYTFKTIGTILSSTERASEKNIIIKNGKANFNTGVFASSSESPFEEKDELIVYKQVSDVIAQLADMAKVSIKYSIQKDIIIVDCDGNVYCEMPIGTAEKTEEFLSPVAMQALKFDANITIINDSFLRLVSTVKSLEYLSDIVKLSFTKDKMKLTISTTNQSKSNEYEFQIVEGAPEIVGDMKLTVEILLLFLKIVGVDCKYAFTDAGLGIANTKGVFLLRKS